MRAHAAEWLALATIIASVPMATAQGQAIIDGFVHNTEGKGAVGVKVAAYASGTKDHLQMTRTDSEGYYKFERPVQSTYDIMYTHSQMDLTTVEWLAENKKQHINIIMYKRGERRSVAAFHDNLQAAERFLFLIATLEPQNRDVLRREFADTGAGTLIVGSGPPLLGDPPGTAVSFINAKRRYLQSVVSELGAK